MRITEACSGEVTHRLTTRRSSELMFSTAFIFSELVSGEGDGGELLGLDSSASDGKPSAARTLGCRSATVCTRKVKVGTSNILKLCLASPN